MVSLTLLWKMSKSWSISTAKQCAISPDWQCEGTLGRHFWENREVSTLSSCSHTPWSCHSMSSLLPANTKYTPTVRILTKLKSILYVEYFENCFEIQFQKHSLGKYFAPHGFWGGVEVLGQSGGLSPIRNPRHVLCHQSPRLHNRLQSWKGSQIKLLKCHAQHSLTLTDWMFVWFVSIFCFLKVYYSHRLVEGRKQLKLACLSANSAVRCTVLHPTRLSTVPSQMAFFPDVRANERLSGND